MENALLTMINQKIPGYSAENALQLNGFEFNTVSKENKQEIMNNNKEIKTIKTESIVDELEFYLHNMDDIKQILDDFIEKHKIKYIKKNGDKRSSYNFCEKYPICFDHYKKYLEIVDDKRKYCKDDHADCNTISKIYNDILYLEKLKNQKNEQEIKKSKTTLEYVMKQFIKMTQNLENIIQSKTVKFNREISIQLLLNTKKHERKCR